MVTQLEIQPAKDRFAKVLSAAWTPRDSISIVEWAEKNIRLSAEWEAGSGSLDLSRRPYWKDVLLAFDDPEVRKITVMKSSQVGGTITLIVAMLARAVLHPAPGMVVTPDRESAIELRDRVYATALESPNLRHLVPPERKWNTRAIDLKHAKIYLAWSGARQRLRGRACRDVYLTEVDVYGADKLGGNAVKAAEGRTKSFRQHKIYKETSLSTDPRVDSTIAKEYEASNQEKWSCPCPQCGKFQEIRFFRLKQGKQAGLGGVAGYTTADGEDLDPDQARKTSHYLCVNGCKIDDAQLNTMIERGRWVPNGQRINKKSQLVGKPARSRRHVGYHIWSIHSPIIDLGQLAAEYIEHKRDGKLPEYFGNWLGLAFKTKRKIRTWQQLAIRLAGEHRRGEIPPDVWFLTGGGDVQDDEAYWVVRGWGDRCRSYKIDWGRIPRTAGDDDITGLTRWVMQRRWPVCGVNPLGKQSLAVRLFGCDANHRTMAVHEWIRQLDPAEKKRVRAVRGDPKVDPTLKYRMNRVDESRRGGDKYEDGLYLWGLYVYHFYEDLFARIEQGTAGDGAWRLTRDVSELGVDYLKHIANFSRKIEVDDSGRKRVVYGPISSSIGVDYWDCEVYARAMAEMIVDDTRGRPGWDAAKWPQPKPAGRPQPRKPGNQPGLSAR